MLLICFVIIIFGYDVVSSQTDAQKFDCHPEKGATQSNCKARGCLWATNSLENGPYCYYPNDWGYTLESSTAKSYGEQYVIKQGKYPNPYGQDINTVNIDVIYDTNTRLRIRMTDPSNSNRYQVPINLPSIPDSKASSPMYSVSQSINSEGIFGLNFTQIVNSKSIDIGTTSLPGFTYSNQFIQFVFGWNPLLNLSSYGWGERYADFIIPYNFTTLPSFSRDIGDANSYRNSYGVHPFLLNIDINTGNSFGIFIVNSNANELVTTPYPAIQYRTIGGIIDMFIFFGPRPQDVISQYWDIIGNPFMPPLWSLGFHLCRYCYNSVNRTRYILERMVNNSIPYDTQWNDIDYMNNHLDFTYDPVAYKGFPQFVDDVHNKYNMKYMHIIDPGIGNVSNYQPFTDGVKQDAFILDSNGDILYGKVWPGTTAFPDFFKQSTKEWWGQQAVNWKKIINYNGWWIDMDEPSNFVTGSLKGCPSPNQYENPPYYPQSLDSSSLAQKTLCMTATQTYGSSRTMHYNVHSLFGLSEMIATAYALNTTHSSTERNFIISRSTYSTSGQYGGHWLGDNNAHYSDMQIAITDIINFNLFGVPMVGTDICGFNGDTTNELCSRWMSIGAFYPFSRNHNTCGAKPQDPPSLGEPVISISRKYLQVRYEILPYLYTLFYESHVNSVTVARSFWLNEPFNRDSNTYSIVNQFMLGDALLISPALNQGQTIVKDAYLPNYVRWYEWFTFSEVITTSTGYISLAAPLDVLPIHLRGGKILTLQNLNGSLTTKEQSVKPYQLLVALDGNNTADGNVYIDDGISINSIQIKEYTLIEYSMSYDQTKKQYTLTNNIINNGFTKMNNTGSLNGIKVVGLNGNINGVTSINIQPNSAFKNTYNKTSGVLELTQLALKVNSQFTVTFVATTSTHNN